MRKGKTMEQMIHQTGEEIDYLKARATEHLERIERLTKANEEGHITDAELREELVMVARRMSFTKRSGKRQAKELRRAQQLLLAVINMN